MDPDQASPLPEPVVPPDAYTEEYYRNWCAGYEEWTESDGARVAGIYPGILHRRSASSTRPRQ